MRDKSISLEDHFLDVLSVEIVNFEKIAHLFKDTDEARHYVDPTVVNTRKLTQSYIRRQKIPLAPNDPYVIYCRKCDAKGEKGEAVTATVQTWYGEDMIMRAVKKIALRGFYSKSQAEEAVAKIGNLGWLPMDHEE